MSKRNLDFLCVPRERIAEIVTTSGTTGKPLVVDVDGSGRAAARAERKNFLRVRRMTSRDTVLVAVALDRCFIAGTGLMAGLRELGCAVVRVGASSAMLVLEMIEHLKPTAIVAVPSFLRRRRRQGAQGKN